MVMVITNLNQEKFLKSKSVNGVIVIVILILIVTLPFYSSGLRLIHKNTKSNSQTQYETQTQ